MNSDEAVSPVIAVILMVAITVVLAATVFVLVSDIGTQGKTAISINFAPKEDTDRLEVVTASQGADWNKVAVRLLATNSVNVNLGVASPYQGDDATTAGGDLSATTNLEVTAATDVIDAAEFLDFCGGVSGTLAAASDVTVVIIDTTANQQIGSYTFSSIAACAS